MRVCWILFHIVFVLFILKLELNCLKCFLKSADIVYIYTRNTICSYYYFDLSIVLREATIKL